MQSNAPRPHTARKADNDRNDETTLLGEKDELRQPDVYRVSTLRRLSSDSWLWEILGVVFSLACSIALVVILRVCDGHPLPKWRFGITLNAVISVLATAAKGSCLLAIGEALGQYKWLWYRRSQRKLEDFDTYDCASRGPWGAWNMLIKINVSDIASMGALITVLSLAFDPFMQQVVMYETRAVHRVNTTLQRSQYYLDQVQSDADSITLGMRAAMYNGLFDNNVAQQISPSCPTGNCTWAPVSSLALCSTCESLAPSAALSCKLTYSGGAYGNGESELKCNYKFSRLLNNFTAYGAIVDGGFTGGTIIQVSALQTISTRDPFQSSGFAFAGRKNPRSGFARVVLDHTLELKPTSIDVCAIYPCIKTYNISVASGTSYRQELDAWAPDEDWTGAAYSLEDQILSPPRDRVSESTHDTTFKIDALTANGVLLLLQTAFDGSAYVDAGSSVFSNYTSDITQAMHLTSTLTQLVDNMTTSISNHMRTTSSDTAVGKVWAMETFVRVRWWWFALPVALGPASCIFLFTAICASWKGEVDIWKSSGLATMFHGLLDDTVQAGKLDHQSGMMDVAKGLHVRLQPAADGVRRLMPGDRLAEEDHVSSLVTSLTRNANDRVRSTAHASPLTTTTADSNETTLARSSTTHSPRRDSRPDQFLIPRRPVGSPTITPTRDS